MIFKVIILLLAPLLYLAAYQQGYNHGYDAGVCEATQPWPEQEKCWMKIYNKEMK